MSVKERENVTEEEKVIYGNKTVQIPSVVRSILDVDEGDELVFVVRDDFTIVIDSKEKR